MLTAHDLNAEWLETDGLGGFASGTVSGLRTRRYHALLLAATKPPAGRQVLVNGIEAWVRTPQGEYALSSQRYAPDAVHPDGASRIASFDPEPWPRWTFALEDGTRVVQEIFIPHERAEVVLAWRLVEPRPGVTLRVRPLFSGRDYHSLHRENEAFRFDPIAKGARLVWRPYPGVPGVVADANGAYCHEPVWYRNFVYTEEMARGLDCVEDLASPGVFGWGLSREEAFLILSAEGLSPNDPSSTVERARSLRTAEASRREQLGSPLLRAAGAYFVRRGSGRTIIAGYPWFTDWGRDTFIAMRGLALATERLDDARSILLEWAGAVSEGMLPNRFPDAGETPEYNSVDASLWYVIAVHDYLKLAERTGAGIKAGDKALLDQAVDAILTGYSAGTRHGIRRDSDGLLLSGEPGVQLTWMDAKVGDWVVTPRRGKPVEVQALWLNALAIGAERSPAWRKAFEQGQASFLRRFPNERRGGLYDVVDVDGLSGTFDDALRPNQILAAGGLPFPILEGESARRMVDLVESRLWTPAGLRSFAPGEPGYVPRYEGGVRERDGAYHQGTVWPWLLGPFVEAWVRVRGGGIETRRQAREKFLQPLKARLSSAGIGHIAEIADAEPPHTPRGCPFQAWSLGELLRLELSVLRVDCETSTPEPNPRARKETQHGSKQRA